MKSIEGVVRVSSSVQTVPPEAAKALEQAWQRRRQELGEWRPSRGWLTDTQISTKRVSTAAAKRAPSRSR